MEKNEKGHYVLPRAVWIVAIPVWLIIVALGTLNFGLTGFVVSLGLFPLFPFATISIFVVIGEGRKLFRGGYLLPRGGYPLYSVVSSDSFVSPVHPVPTSPPRSSLACRVTRGHPSETI